MNAWPTFVCLALVAFGGLSCARSALMQPRGLPRTLAAAVLGWAWITVGMQVLGSVGLMRVGWLLGWSGVAGLAGRRSCCR